MDQDEHAEELLNKVLSENERFLPALFTRALLRIKHHQLEKRSDIWDRLRMFELSEVIEWLIVDQDEYRKLLSDDGFFMLCDVVIGPGTSAHLEEIAETLQIIQDHAQLNDWKGTVGALEKLNSLGVHKLWPQLRLAESLYHQGDTRQSLAILTALKAHYPDTVPVLYNLGHISLEEGHYHSARELLQAVHAKKPDQPLFVFRLACAYIMLGKREEAWDILFRLAHRHPGKLRRWMREDVNYMTPLQTDKRFRRLLSLVEI
jgi:tetratricopeptide (TPR) repeat protein